MRQATLDEDLIRQQGEMASGLPDAKLRRALVDAIGVRSRAAAQVLMGPRPQLGMSLFSPAGYPDINPANPLGDYCAEHLLGCLQAAASRADERLLPDLEDLVGHREILPCDDRVLAQAKMTLEGIRDAIEIRENGGKLLRPSAAQANEMLVRPATNPTEPAHLLRIEEADGD